MLDGRMLGLAGSQMSPNPAATAEMKAELERLHALTRAQLALEVLKLPKFDADGVSAEVCAAANAALAKVLEP